MEFKELLAKWNRGISRGSQRKFAKAVGVKEAAVSEWVRLARAPGEVLRIKVARELGIPVDELMRCFTAPARPTESFVREGYGARLDRSDPVIQEIFLRLGKMEQRMSEFEMTGRALPPRKRGH